ncbi:MAG: flavin reductase family protein [Spirochaetaceae bacterium]|jgi:flavin reductase (DIM6/NTAB) family NADH-FMN oxidoreductase RutF|nr:flavin reductase family protein [Spirochaetaceae bacterium]
MSKKELEPFRPISPTPAALITSIDSRGVPNIITLGEAFNLGLQNPCIVGVAIRKSRYSHSLIRAEGSFTVNLPRASQVKNVDLCGVISGRKADKFALTGFTPVPSRFIAPPMIAECPVSMECELTGIIETGDHDLFMGKVLAVYADEEILDDLGRVSPEKMETLVFMNNFNHPPEYWSLGKKIASLGFSLKD